MVVKQGWLLTTSVILNVLLLWHKATTPTSSLNHQTSTCSCTVAPTSSAPTTTPTHNSSVSRTISPSVSPAVGTRRSAISIATRQIQLRGNSRSALALLPRPTPTHLHFVHMRKAGGTTVGDYIRKMFTSASACCKVNKACGRDRTRMRPKQSWIRSDVNEGWLCTNLSFAEEEYDPEAVAEKLADPSAVTITTLRNPVDRHVSLFFYESQSWLRFKFYIKFRHCGCVDQWTAERWIKAFPDPKGDSWPNLSNLSVPRVCDSPCDEVDGVPIDTWAKTQALRSVPLWEHWMARKYPGVGFRSGGRGVYAPNYYTRKLGFTLPAGYEGCWAGDTAADCRCIGRRACKASAKRTVSLPTFDDVLTRMQQFDAVLLLDDSKNWQQTLHQVLSRIPAIDKLKVQKLSLTAKKQNSRSIGSYQSFLPPIIRDRMLRENDLDVRLYEAMAGRQLRPSHTVTDRSH